ncbi:hypothetical protein [Burkholderia anthina]|uniref:hypothetical protein n=1 Tax=Burkholderia anthina TaxID=179879 RepID=UPI00292E2B5A|nr:hypothetical protein [Burkholderia anthina]WJN74411.1 hypothetical protein OH687_29300 [Burkholderia anthina]
MSKTLTADQRHTLAMLLEGDVLSVDEAGVVREILATQQPEPRDEVTDTPRTARRHWNPVYNTDPVQRACTELPEGWSISACMEREAGWVDVYGPDGKEPNFEGDSDHFDWLIHQAIDFAIDAARTGASHE